MVLPKGCSISNCALIGGETAEMPGIYAGEDFDLAGFSVGAFERGCDLPSSINAGDLLLGLPSSGIHSNGFSLVRKIVELSGANYNSPCPFSDNNMADELLKPTEIYVKPCLEAIGTRKVVGLAHITGGGITENIIRILKPGQGLEIDLGTWPLPPVFEWLAREGSVDPLEMLKTFNCGIGMVLIVPASSKVIVKNILENFYDQIFEIGMVTEAEGVSFSGALL
jgi:phosphoribosylformylglycinamidine cyclo-ligase